MQFGYLVILSTGVIRRIIVSKISYLLLYPHCIYHNLNQFIFSTSTGFTKSDFIYPKLIILPSYDWIQIFF